MFVSHIEELGVPNALDWGRKRKTQLAKQLRGIVLPAACSDKQRTKIDVGYVTSTGELECARALVNKMYAWRGYGHDHLIPSGLPCTTFVASSDDTLLGTVTLTADSASGLTIDETFPEEVNQLRSQPGTFLCEMTKLASDANRRTTHLLAAFFHIILIVGRQKHPCTHLLIEVNPRHVAFYRAMLGFDVIGDLKVNEEVNAASQLMCLPIAAIDRRIAKARQEVRGTRDRSLYAMFFSSEEEAEINRRVEAVGKRAALKQVRRGAIGLAVDMIAALNAKAGLMGTGWGLPRPISPSQPAIAPPPTTADLLWAVDPGLAA